MYLLSFVTLVATIHFSSITNCNRKIIHRLTFSQVSQPIPEEAQNGPKYKLCWAVLTEGDPLIREGSGGGASHLKLPSGGQWGQSQIWYRQSRLNEHLRGFFRNENAKIHTITLVFTIHCLGSQRMVHFIVNERSNHIHRFTPIKLIVATNLTEGASDKQASAILLKVDLLRRDMRCGRQGHLSTQGASRSLSWLIVALDSRRKGGSNGTHTLIHDSCRRKGGWNGTRTHSSTIQRELGEP